MDVFGKSPTENPEQEKCIAHCWKSASNTVQILEFTVNTGIKSVALGSEHCLFLGYNGRVFARGCNKFGQLGLGDLVERKELTEVQYLSTKNVLNVECGSRHSGVLTEEGHVYCWGDAGSGQCGVGEMVTVNEPARVFFIDSNGQDTSSVIRQLAFGELHSLGLSDKGQVWAWGSGCTLGFGNDLARALTPQLIEDFRGKKVVSIASGNYHSLAIIDVENSTKIKTNKDDKTASPDELDGVKRRLGLSTRIKIPLRTIKEANKVERSKSVPITRTASTSPISLNESSSDSDNDSKKSVKSGTLTPSDVELSVSNDSSTSTDQSLLSESLDAGFSKLTDVVKKSVNGVLSYTTALTGQNSTTDDLATDGPAAPIGQQSTSKIRRKQPKMNLQGCSPVSVQVWAWGRGTFGQLGHGTTEDRPYPCLIDELCGVHIVKVVAGNHHSLALTSYCQVYAWGDNSHAQLGIKKNVINKPRKVKSLSNVLVWDIAAGSHYSLFLGDSFQNHTDVYVCGKKPSGLPMSCMNSLMDYRDNFATPVQPDEFFNQKGPGKKASTLPASKSETDISTITTLSQGVKIGQMTYFRKCGVLRGIYARGEQCICLSVKEPSCWLSIVAELASRERVFYYKLALVWQSMLEPLMAAVLPTLAKNEQYSLTLTQMCKAFHHVMRHVAATCKRLEQVVSDVMFIGDAVSVLSDEKYFNAFDKYSKVHSDCIACGVLDSLGKDASSVFIKSRFVFEEILDEFSTNAKSNNEAFREILKLPLQRISQFSEKIFALQSSLTESSTESKSLHDVGMQWKELVSTDNERIIEAKLTNEFWQECPAKLAETYKRPFRRLLISSKVCDLFLPKSGRFSSHWFVLLTDTFVHIMSNKTFVTYDLSTVWASPVPDVHAENFTNAIKITTPEESFTSCSKTSTEKVQANILIHPANLTAQWLVAINQAVAKVLSKTTPHRLSSETVNTRVGSFTPAKARQATYFYSQDPKYKGACYTGMWLSGKPHGHGKMVWSSTAQTYEGEFRNGLFNGFGRMIFVRNASAGVAEEYKGEWKDGMMHGQGEMSYSDKQLYIGHWMHNVRHGHGVLRMGTITSPTPSIFTGNWDNDKRSGFGVMDDIMKGEKYMGMWDNDNRSGNGLIVTLDGIYNEGRFSLNKLMGQGVLLCHDNTKFEGDFSGDAQMNGKGVLTMPNGDRIEGTFQGQWNDGLKINGIYFKGSEPNDNSAITLSQRAKSAKSPYYIPASKKWRSVFNECRDRLGCLGNDEPDLKKAWKCVAEDLVRAPPGNSMHQEREIIDDVLKGIDLDRAKKIAKDKKKLQEYLTKAFSLPCHPLGRLIETLVDVYRATYVGMGAHSRLLPHAVEEIKSYIERVYAMIRILFPSLPNEDFVHLGDLVDTGDQSGGEILDSNTLLGPLIFPRFYPPLFTLYALHNEKNDSAYWERVLQLNKRTDLALMSYLEVKRTFWLASEQTDGLVYEADLTHWKHTHYYKKAVDAFQQISTKFSPMEKISVLKETFHRIHTEVQNFWKGKAKLMSLDDLFPVFQFVVIRSRVHHLGSEIDFIEDLMQAKYRAGEQGHMFTTLKLDALKTVDDLPRFLQNNFALLACRFSKAEWLKFLLRAYYRGLNVRIAVGSNVVNS